MIDNLTKAIETQQKYVAATRKYCDYVSERLSEELGKVNRLRFTDGVQTEVRESRDSKGGSRFEIHVGKRHISTVEVIVPTTPFLESNPILLGDRKVISYWVGVGRPNTTYSQQEMCDLFDLIAKDMARVII